MTAAIRPGEDSDGPGYLALIGSCWAEYPGPFDVVAEIPDIHALATSLRQAGGAVWTADDAGQVVGMIATYPAEGGWHVARMYVHTDYRGTGLASLLLGRAEDHARAHGALRAVLWSDVLFTRAHAFYEKQGYVRRAGLRPLANLSQTIEAGYAKPLTGLVVERLDVAAAESAERALAGILQRCVAAGASVSFLPPLSHLAATDFWRMVTKAVGRGDTMLFAAWLDGVLAGTVQLGLDTPPNQPHRAEIRKLLTDPAARRNGVATSLMQAAEQAADAAGRTLLTLDTLAGDAGEALYRTMGWVEAGRIPGYALDATGTAHATVLFYKPAARL